MKTMFARPTMGRGVLLMAAGVAVACATALSPNPSRAKIAEAPAEPTAAEQIKKQESADAKEGAADHERVAARDPGNTSPKTENEPGAEQQAQEKSQASAEAPQAAAEQGNGESPEELDPLAELAALGDAIQEEGPEAGGSIRAKRDVDRALLDRINDGRNVLAKVVRVKVGRFPTVALVVKVRKPATQGVGKATKKNQKLVVIPKLAVQNGKVAMDDPSTLRNAGAFYLRSGDRVVIRLGDKQGAVWPAEYIERK